MSKSGSRLFLAGFLLCGLIGWAGAQICPICGKRSCPWYVHPGAARRPTDLEKRIKQEVLRSFPDWVRAQERGMPLPELLRLARDIQRRPDFKAAVGARLAQDAEYNRYRTAVLQEGERRLRESQARLAETMKASYRDAKEAIARLAGSDPALQPASEAQKRLLIDSPDLGQLFLAVGAGKLAKGSIEHAAKAVASIPFDDGTGSGGSISAAARGYRENLAAAVQKQHEAILRFQNIQEASPTAAERAELMSPGAGKEQARRSLGEQAGAGSAGHAEARERLKGLVIIAPPVPKPEESPKRTAAALREWGTKTAEAMVEWTVRVHDRYPASPPKGDTRR